METNTYTSITEKSTLAELVNASINYAEVFDTFDIDYGNHGRLTLKEAAERWGIDGKLLVKELAGKDRSDKICRHVNEWDVSFLCDFISTNFHTRLLENVPAMLSLFKSLERKRFITRETGKAVHELSEDIHSHIQKERKMLYPYIKKISGSASTGVELPLAPFGLISKPIKVLEREHLQFSAALDSLIKTLVHLRKEASADEIDRLIKLLREFLSGMRLYIHFENNILFPKAAALERRIHKSKRNSTQNKKSKTT